MSNTAREIVLTMAERLKLGTRIAELVEIQDDGCWYLRKHVNKGYPRFKWDGRMVRANRLAVAIRDGVCPAGMLVAHECEPIHTDPDAPLDTTYRLCVRPDHLRVDDFAGNYRDARDRGRRPNRLTEDDVREIRRLASEGVSYPVIAQGFDASEAAVYFAGSGRSWRHVA